MSEKLMLLRDKNVIPTDEEIYSGLGNAAEVYQEFLKELEKQGITMMKWRFYNDGKAWLSKGEYHWQTSRGTDKVKPIFWLSIWPGFFKVLFNFNEKTREVLLALPLSGGTKAKIREVPANGQKMKYIGLIFDVNQSEQLADIYEIAAYRKQYI